MAYYHDSGLDHASCSCCKPSTHRRRPIIRYVYRPSLANSASNQPDSTITNKATASAVLAPNLPDPIINESDAVPGEKECVVCMTRSIKTLLLPCGHAALCVTCALQIGLTVCPLCSTKIEEIKRIYL